MGIEGDAAIAILTRIESVNDRVTDISGRMSDSAETIERLTAVEGKTDMILNDLKEIKAGPVYSLDQFITKRVAQATGGMSVLFLLGAWVLTNWH
tara:strand:- start:4710 stop:4994 length:285 start_codon:yes stop_codon:yes gene_type:complete